MRLALYTRVSTREQGHSGLGLEAQKRSLYAEAAHRGHDVTGFAAEVASTRDTLPQLEQLMTELDQGMHDALMVRRLDRFCRSMLDLALALERSRKHGWHLIMLDPAVDTTTPYGEAIAGMSAVWAQLERALIAQRTSEGLAVARDRGTFRPGAHCRFTDQDVIARMLAWRAQGYSNGRIAARLQAEGVPAPARPRRTGSELTYVHADRWHPRTVGRILARQ